LGNKIKAEEWPQPLTITAGNLRWGGLYPPHFTHRRGASLDLRPMSTDGNPTWCSTNGECGANYDRQQTIRLVKILKAAGAVKIYFNDPETFAYGAQPLSGHHNHLHVTWLNGDNVINPTF